LSHLCLKLATDRLSCAF